MKKSTAKQNNTNTNHTNAKKGNITGTFFSRLKAQTAQEEVLPKITQHIDDEIVHFADGRMGFVLRLDGVYFEGVDDHTLITQFANLNQTFADLGKDGRSKLGMWLTLHRSRITANNEMKFHNPFTKKFAQRYMKQFENGDFFENVYYIAVIYKYDDFTNGKVQIHRYKNKLKGSLAAYSPEVLSVYYTRDNQKYTLNTLPEKPADDDFSETAEKIRKLMPTPDDIYFSEVYEYVGLLSNGVFEQVPLSAKDAYTVIGSSDLHFGNEIVEIRATNQTKFATLYDLKEFGQSKIKALNQVLDLDCEFLFTQSFVYIGQMKMQEKIDRKMNELRSVGEVLGQQYIDLNDAKNHISEGFLMFGDYHGVLTVYGRTPDEVKRDCEKVTTRFLNAGSFVWKRATITAPQSYFSHIFGFKGMPRRFPKATTNIATSFAMFNHSHGKRLGNPYGDGSSVMPLMTKAETRYDFNFHFTKEGEDTRGKKIAGHTLILGATGTGKTTLQTALLSFMERFNPYIFALDLDRGMEIWIRALGGEYFALETGKPSGLNPFQLPNTEENRHFLYSLVELCGQNEQGRVSAEERQQIKLAVDTLMMSVDFEERRFSRLMESIPIEDEDPNSLRVRLSQWCYCDDGKYAWCLDSPKNLFDPEQFFRIGIDLTCILQKNYEPTLPVMMYLFRLKEIMMNKISKENGLLCTIFEEFWYSLRHPVTADFLVKILKTDRKLGGFAVLVTQSPEDVINSENFATIVQQTPTKILLPNPDAKYDDGDKGGYKHIGLTEKQFNEIKKLDLASRTFAVKQGKQWALAKLDLYGFNDEIAVLSGTSANLLKMQEAINETDNNPEHWLPVFYAKVRNS